MKNGAWKKWSDSLKKNTHALYLASRDPRVAVSAKVILGIVVAYALSPIDLIPDFIPVAGYLDDLLLLPIGIWLAIRLIPEDVWRECKALAQEQAAEPAPHRRAAVIIVLIWFLAIVGFILWVRPLANGLRGH